MYKLISTYFVSTMATSSDTSNPHFARRKALKVAVTHLCVEAGFTNADESPLETLIEMLQSCK